MTVPTSDMAPSSGSQSSSPSLSLPSQREASPSTPEPHQGWNINHQYGTHFRLKHTINLALFTPPLASDIIPRAVMTSILYQYLPLLHLSLHTLFMIPLPKTSYILAK